MFGRGGGGGPKVGGLGETHYYHMHTSRGDVCLGVWGYGGKHLATNDICIASRLAISGAQKH